jgi:DNA-binding transcriptional MocR family regulator
VNATGRSKGEGQFLALPYSTAASPAFRSLSGAAVKVWVELRCRFNGANNGRLSLSWDQGAALLGLSKTTVGRAFRELAAKGFVRLRKAGQWYGRRAAEYVLTDISFDGYPPTRDWERWRPPAPAENPTSVPARPRQAKTGPPGYRNPDFADRESTRQRHLRVIDGAG